MPITMMHPRNESVLELFEFHRTIRHYKPDPISEADVAWIQQAGRRAPTDATGFMYTIIRVKDAKKRAAIAPMTGNNPHILTAAEFYLICLDFHRQRRLVEAAGGKPAKLGNWALLFGVTDAMLVAENMAVAAEALGYGTGFIGGVQKDAAGIAKLLGCPRGVFPLVGLTIGVIERVPEPRKRLPPSATFHEDGYHDLSEAELKACFDAMKSESGKFDWGNSLRRYFTEGGEMESRESTIAAGLRAQGLIP